MINVWDTVYTYIHLPRMFLSTDIFFEQRIEQFILSLFSYVRFIKPVIISRNIPCWATDSPYGVGGHGWPTYLLYGGPLLDLCF